LIRSGQKKIDFEIYWHRICYRYYIRDKRRYERSVLTVGEGQFGDIKTVSLHFRQDGNVAVSPQRTVKKIYSVHIGSL
jgi:hypothetical protein